MAGLSFKLGMDSAAFEKGIDKAKGTLKSFAGAIGGFFAISAIKGMIDDFDALGKRAEDLGMRASGLLALREAAEHAGMEAGQLDSAIKSFSDKALKGDEAFKKLGISLTDSKGQLKTTGELLYETADKMKEMQGSTEAAAAQVELFGGDNLAMQRVLEQGSEVLKDFREGIDEAAMASARLNDAMSDAKQLATEAVAKTISNVQVLFDMIGDLASGRSYDFTFAQKENERLNREVEKNRKRQEAAQQRAMAEQRKREEELAKQREADELDHQKTRQETADIVAKYQWEELSTAEKVAKKKEELKKLEAETRTLAQSSHEYAIVQNEYAKGYVELKKLEKELQREINDEAKKKADEDKKRQDREKKFLDDKKKAEKSLQDLYEERARIVNETLQKQSEAQSAMLDRIGSSGAKTGDAKRNVDKAKEYGNKAEQAFGEGRMGDYTKYKRQQEKAEQRAIEKQKEKLERAGADALKKGDKDTYNRLKKEYEQAGLGNKKKPVDEAVKEIDEKVKEMKDHLAELVNGLKEG